jgi:salicylate hydroxylase
MISRPGFRNILSKLYTPFNKRYNLLKRGYRHAENIKLWQLRDQDPLPTYVRGRTVLIGDSAHAMTPHQGQGGTQAVEDAEAFRLFLADNVTSADVPSILKDFDSVRRPRASQIQDNTRKATEQRTPEEVFSFAKYNWTYPGVIEGLKRVRAGEKLIQF